MHANPGHGKIIVSSCDLRPVDHSSLPGNAAKCGLWRMFMLNLNPVPSQVAHWGGARLCFLVPRSHSYL